MAAVSTRPSGSGLLPLVVAYGNDRCGVGRASRSYHSSAPAEFEGKAPSAIPRLSTDPNNRKGIDEEKLGFALKTIRGEPRQKTDKTERT